MTTTSLVVDIGNTRRKIGLFQNGNLLEALVASDWTAEDLWQYCREKQVGHSLYCNVGAPEQDWKNVLLEHAPSFELDHQTPLPFENRYSTPQTLGKDRLAAISGAHALYSGEHCLVVDAGTCIKYDIIDRHGVYWGGNISPGLDMRAKAMHDYTARLPLVTQALPEDFCGDSTQSALQNGAFRGAVLEIEGFIRLFQQQYSPLRVVLSGGDADFLSRHIKHPSTTLTPHITLFGLYHILSNLLEN